jgi:hypothetical protein
MKFIAALSLQISPWKYTIYKMSLWSKLNVKTSSWWRIQMFAKLRRRKTPQRHRLHFLLSESQPSELDFDFFRVTQTARSSGQTRRILADILGVHTCSRSSDVQCFFLLQKMYRNSDNSLSSVTFTCSSLSWYNVVASSFNRDFLRCPDSPGFHETCATRQNNKFTLPTPVQLPTVPQLRCLGAVFSPSRPRVQSRVTSCEICGERSGTEAGPSPSPSVSPRCHDSTIAPYACTTAPRGVR